MKSLRFLLLVLAAAPLLSAHADVFGGAVPEKQLHTWRVGAGFIAGIEGSIDETFRAYYKASGQDSKQALAESYDLDDFGIEAPYPVFNLTYERQWEYTAFRWNTIFMSLSTSATAKRDYFLGLNDDISYNGRDYDHLKIERGQDFSADFNGVMTDLTFGITPFSLTMWDGYISFTPSLDLGVVLVLGQYDIDAGASKGTTVYQNPPVDFVIGGSSSSLIGVGAPVIGASAELDCELINDSHWVSRVGFSYFAYDGSSTPFTSSSHREKNLDISMLSLYGETGLMYPLESGNALSFGVRLQMLSLDAEITSKEKDTEAIIASRERFDKSATFDLYTMLFFVGFSY